MEMFSMRRIEPITIKLAKVNREDNFVTSTKEWIKEMKKDIKWMNSKK
tara:strand:+ start:123 stop:266 length:144 start_codon:yes stop_codon:yes gene_type:complete